MRYQIEAVSALLTALLLGLPAFAQDSRARFVPLGDLAGGTFESRAAGITPDGSVVLGWSEGPEGRQRFRWTQTAGMVALPDPALDDVDFHGGEFTVDHGFETGWRIVTGRPFAWRRYAESLLLPDFSLASQGFATDISIDGSVVVGRTESETSEQAYRWTHSSGFEGLGTCDGSRSSRTTQVSWDGVVAIGQCLFPTGQQAFRWTEPEGMRALGTLGPAFHSSSATQISGDGSVIVGYSQDDSGPVGFRWMETTGMTILAPDHPRCIPEGVSLDGSVIVGWECASPKGFIWNETRGLMDFEEVLGAAGIDLTGWDLFPVGISADGLTVAGTGLNPDGMFEAWIAALPAHHQRVVGKERAPLDRPQ